MVSAVCGILNAGQSWNARSAANRPHSPTLDFPMARDRGLGKICRIQPYIMTLAVMVQNATVHSKKALEVNSLHDRCPDASWTAFALAWLGIA